MQYPVSATASRLVGYASLHCRPLHKVFVHVESFVPVLIRGLHEALSLFPVIRHRSLTLLRLPQIKEAFLIIKHIFIFLLIDQLILYLA